MKLRHLLFVCIHSTAYADCALTESVSDSELANLDNFLSEKGVAGGAGESIFRVDATKYQNGAMTADVYRGPANPAPRICALSLARFEKAEGEEWKEIGSSEVSQYMAVIPESLTCAGTNLSDYISVSSVGESDLIQLVDDAPQILELTKQTPDLDATVEYLLNEEELVLEMAAAGELEDLDFDLGDGFFLSFSTGGTGASCDSSVFLLVKYPENDPVVQLMGYAQ